MEPEFLFRHEAGRLVATLTKIFGVHNLALAEDVVQDAFCRALEVWKFRGVPDNPSAWLMATAKHRALDVLRRERTARTFAPELTRLLESEWTLAPIVEEQFAVGAMKDDQLRMMFSCCHPRLKEDAQVALILNILCGFGVDEIAAAFVSKPATIEKRLSRAKKVLAGSKRLFDISESAIASRLPGVQRALYLLFNEGYHGASPEGAVRSDLCREAMRLVDLLLEHPLAAAPGTYALGALMALHAARLPARLTDAGDVTSLFDQDRSRWDAALARKGLQLLERSAEGSSITEFHVEAAIASMHAIAPRAEDTDWARIVSFYDTLMRLRPSPVVALNRAMAVAQLDGPARGLEAIRAIEDAQRLEEYVFYPAALGELELRLGQRESAGRYFTRALELARNPTERRFFQARIDAVKV